MSVNSESIVSDVSENNQFWLKDIGPVKNLKELADSLRKISDDVFKHHASKERNDFSNWVSHVIKDDKLAGAIKKIKNKKKMAKIIEKRISKLKKENKEKHKPPKIEKIEEIKPKKIEIPKKLPEVNIKKKIDEVLEKEREIQKKEEIIQRTEEKIERMLEENKNKKPKFFSREFVQGLIIGILLSAIAWLVYNAFLKGLI